MTNTSPTLAFRPDINALRAVAVLMVMFYHFGLFGVSGGFAGVDVFFVISGFLMTQIILGKATFSLAGFYAARARRIFPALLALCAVLLTAGWFFLSPSDYDMLGQHVAASASYVSNFVYKGEEGYFDAPSVYKWLLHTWSLSVEWQFYLIYPLMLMPLRRRAHLQVRVLAGLALFFFVFSAVITPLKPDFAFYILPARVWEMVAGGLVFLLGPSLRWKDAHRRALAWAGLGLLLLSAFIFTADTLWPGHAALLPVAGAALLLLAARQNGFFAENVFLQALGRWSYSIYLWHWPLVVCLVYANAQGDKTIALAAAILAVALGWASYRLVEQPARHALSVRHGRALWQSCAAAAVVIVCGLMVTQQAGFPARIAGNTAAQLAEAGEKPGLSPLHVQNGQSGCGFSRKEQKLYPCVLGDAGQPISFVVWGDSHAGAIADAVHEALGVKTSGFVFSHQCATVFDSELRAKGLGNHCPAFNDAALAEVEKLPAGVPVIVANRYSANIHGPNEGVRKDFGVIFPDHPDATPAEALQLYRERLPQSLCRIAKTHPVYAVLPIPEIGIDVPKTLSRHAMFSDAHQKDITLPRADYDSRNADAIAALQAAHESCGVRLIDPTAGLCDGAACHGSIDGHPLYSDDDHLNAAGRARVQAEFDRALRGQ